jgi:hypothetical protein
MDTTELIRSPAAPRRAVSELPSFREMLAETIPLVGAIAGYGPPVIFLACPWLLLALVLSGPFAFLLVLVVAMVVVATILVALAAAIVGTPYLLIRGVRSYRARRTLSTSYAGHLVPIGSTRVAS